MISSHLAAFLLGLASAVSWGAGDFSGGLATKQTNVYTVVIFSQVIGAVLLGGLAVLLSEPFPGWLDVGLGGLAGISGAVGVVALYQGLAMGHMGTVAPVAAVITAIIPVTFGFLTQGFPGTWQLLGFAVALPAIWLLSQAENGEKSHKRDLILPVIAGLGFAGFYVLVGQVSDGAIYWPLFSARIVSISMLLIVALFLGQAHFPQPSKLPIIALAGIFDAGGNAFYALATQIGRLDVSAVLASLYPGSTVFLAFLVLNERLYRKQLAGVVLALISLVLIAL